MVSKTTRYKSIKVSAETLIKIAEIFEKAQKEEQTDSKYAKLDLRLKLRNDETYTFDSAKQMQADFDDLLEEIESFDFRMYSDDLTISIYTWSMSAQLNVESRQRPRLLDMHEKINKKIKSEKNHNWILHSFIIQMALCFFIGIMIGILGTQILQKINSDVDQSIQFLILIMLVLIVNFALIPIMYWFEKKYPLVLVYNSSRMSGRDLKKDWYLLVSVLLLPVLINLLF